jgi:hypothetical protein
LLGTLPGIVPLLANWIKTKKGQKTISPVKGGPLL